MAAALLFAAVVAGAIPTGGVLTGEQAAYDTMLSAQVHAANATFTGSACDEGKLEVVSIAPWRVNDSPGMLFWRERVRITGCGHTAVENINVGRVGGAATWRMTFGLPGSTLADMQLQSSTFPAALAQARAGLADCKVPSLDDVYVAARIGDVDFVAPGATPPKARKGHPTITLPETISAHADELSLPDAWMEVWPFQVCGHDRTLGVLFIPLKNHTASAYLFQPIWQLVEAHGVGARPAPVSVEP